MNSVNSLRHKDDATMRRKNTPFQKYFHGETIHDLMDLVNFASLKSKFSKIRHYAAE